MASIPFAEVASIKQDGTKSDYHISLNKLLKGKKVADIEGYITTEFGDPCFQISNIILDDGRRLGCGGEHDLPYIEADLPTDLDDIKHED